MFFTAGAHLLLPFLHIFYDKKHNKNLIIR